MKKGCDCTNPSVHKYDGIHFSSFTDTKTAEDVMHAYIMTLYSHPSFDIKSPEYVYCVMLNRDQVVDTKNIELREISRNDPILKGMVHFEHSYASDGKHVIIFVILRYGIDKISKASGFIPFNNVHFL
jgi:hypothetical protein